MKEGVKRKESVGVGSPDTLFICGPDKPVTIAAHAENLTLRKKGSEMMVRTNDPFLFSRSCTHFCFFSRKCAVLLRRADAISVKIGIRLSMLLRVNVAGRSVCVRTEGDLLLLRGGPRNDYHCNVPSSRIDEETSW